MKKILFVLLLITISLFTVGCGEPTLEERIALKNTCEDAGGKWEEITNVPNYTFSHCDLSTK